MKIYINKKKIRPEKNEDWNKCWIVEYKKCVNFSVILLLTLSYMNVLKLLDIKFII